jgi:hypothetical protein
MDELDDIWVSPTGAVFVSHELIDQIKSFPTSSAITHCDQTIDVSPLDIHATCPTCNKRVKLRSFSANYELEDLFDAVFEWLAEPEGKRVFEKRLKEILDDRD